MRVFNFLFYWIIVPLCIFIIFYLIGESSKDSLECIYHRTIHKFDNIKISSHENKMTFIDNINGSDFQEHRNEHFADMHFPLDTLLLDPHHHPKSCSKIANAFVDMSNNGSCLAIAWTSTPHSHNVLRYRHPTINSFYALNHGLQTGFFIRPGNLKGRVRFIEKLAPFIKHLSEINKLIRDKLYDRKLYPGKHEMVVMVVNDGEMDLFINFACSCYFHNISMNNMVVFAGSE
jgi:hypothetical protein